MLIVSLSKTCQHRSKMLMSYIRVISMRIVHITHAFAPALIWGWLKVYPSSTALFRGSAECRNVAFGSSPSRKLSSGVLTAR